MHFARKDFLILLFLLLTFSAHKLSAQTANFNFVISANGCDIATYNFSDQSTGPNLTNLYYEWIFGNGNSVQETPANDAGIQFPSASYNNSGTFTVTLNLRNGFNGTVLSTVSKQVIVYESANPDFTADVLSGCTNLTVNFSDITDTSSPTIGNVTRWTWNFGDGNTFSGTDPVFSANPQHTYLFSGDYQVTLTVETFSGGIQTCAASEIKSSYIRVRYSPVASFVLNNPPACAVPFTAQFRSTSTVRTTPPPAGNIITYNWTFYDTNGSTILGTSSSQNPSFTYTTKGIYPVKLRVRTADGCADSITVADAVRINDNLANFTLPTANVCASTALQFFDNSSTGAMGWSWDFGDFSPLSTQKNPTHTYANPGTYSVRLTTTFSDGCSVTSVPQPITIQPQPSAGFTIIPVVGLCQVPRTITFNPVTTGAQYTYSWNFGDPNVFGGGTSTASNPMHTYTDFGTNTVILTITNTITGCSSTGTLNIPIEEPVIVFSADAEEGCAPLTVNFDATGTDANEAIISYVFDFGDGSPLETIPGPTSTPQTSHIYTAFGDYTPTLTITTSNGCTRTVALAPIEVGEPPTLTGITLSRPGGCVNDGGGITFTPVFSGLVVADSLIWDFSDGTIINNDNINPVTHLFRDIGSLTVTLTAFANGCQVLVPFSQNVNISGPLARFQIVGGGSACVGTNTFNFNNQSLNGPNSTYTWNFGDGSPTQIIPQGSPVSHTYTSPGIYTVSLTANDSNTGCVSIASAQVNVSVSGADFTTFPNPADVCRNNAVQFIDQSTTTGTIVRWIWDFGDGTIEEFTNNPNTTHNYAPKATPYQATLTIEESNGCTTTSAAKPVTVSGPRANFTSNIVVCEGESLSFTDTSLPLPGTSTINSWLWDFGDPVSGVNNSSALQNPSHIFSGPGTYTVRLTVEDDNVSLGTCSHAVSKTVQVLAKPRAGFTTTRNKYCLSNSILFTNTSTDIPGGTGLTYSWNFGGSGTNLSVDPANPEFVYDFTGTYVVTLTVQANNGCSRSFSKTVFVVNPDATMIADGVIAPSTLTRNCPPATVSFVAVPSSGAGITSYFWEFGDGNVAFTQNPKNTYSVPGNYTVTLTMTSDAGCDIVKTITNFITVDGPAGSFTFVPTRICAPETVEFTAASISGLGGTGSTIQWDFGDGTTTAEIPLTQAEYNAALGTIPGKTIISHTYTIPGVYIPFMILKDDLGCKVSYTSQTGTVSVSGQPTANFTWDNGGGLICQGINFNFQDLSLGNQVTPNSLRPEIDTWNWTFYDTDSVTILGTSTQRNPTRMYNASGIYPVRLVVESAFNPTYPPGCSDTTFRYVEIITPSITANFTVDQNLICPGEVVNFTNSSVSTNNPPLSLAYLWEFLNDAGNVIGTSNAVNPNFTFTSTGDYTVRLTVTDNAGCAASAVKTNEITVNELPSFGEQPLNTVICSGNDTSFVARATSAALSIADINYQWQIDDGGGWANLSNSAIYGNTSGVLNASLPSTTLTLTGIPLSFNGYRYRCVFQHINTTQCIRISNEAVLTVNQSPTPATVGPNQILCNATSATITGNTPSVGTGLWTQLSGPAGAIITNPTNPNTQVNIGFGTYEFQWTISNGVCPPTSATIQIANSQSAFAGLDQSYCHVSSFNLNGSNPATTGGGTGTWTFLSGPNTPNIDLPNDPNSSISNVIASATPYRFVWSIIGAAGCGNSKDTVSIFNYALPSFTGQPSDITLCENQNGTISVNASAAFTYQWQLDDGGGSGFTNISDGAFYSGTNTNTLNLTGVNISLDFAKYRCLITNPGTSCENFSQEAELRIIPAPNNTVIADNSSICAGNPVNISVYGTISGYTYVLRNGTNPVAGVPPLTGNGATISFATINPTSTSTYNVLVTTSAVNGSSCSIMLTDQPTITVTPATSPSVTGADFAVCADVANLSANAPANGTGLWTLVSGSGTITNPNNRNSGVTALGLGRNVFRWTISNGLCPSTQDTLVITRNQGVTANAGSDQVLCGTSTILSANSSISGFGTWSLLSGTGTIVNVNDPASAFINVALGQNVLLWTLDNGSCPPSSDTVIIQRESSNAFSDAGSNQEICVNNTTLAANTPIAGTGVWSVVAGSGTIADLNNPNTSVTNLGNGLNTFEWTVSNPCATAISRVDVVVSNPTFTADAGANQTVCTPTATLNALPVPVGQGVGSWQVTSGGATLNNPSDPNSTVSGLTPGLNTFRWFVSNGVCPSSEDLVSITRVSITPVSAGNDATVCGTSAVLNANDLDIANGETGVWTVEAGTGIFVDATDPKSGVSGLASGALNRFRWTVSKASCATVSDVVDITAVAAPIASAGVTQNICSDQTILNATLSNGNGLWSSTDPNVSFDNPSQPNTLVRGLVLGGNTLTWTVSNANCPSAISTVIIHRMSPPTLSDAGTDQVVCSDIATLDANTPVIGAGVWNVVSGSGTVEILDDPNSAVNGLSLGENIFRWTISNGTCPVSTSTVKITRVQPPTLADAGPNQTVCSAIATLDANTPIIGTGVWTVTAGSAVLDNPNDPNSGVSNLSIGANVLRWTISNGTCPVSTATVTITRHEDPSLANAGLSQTICATSTNLNASVPTVGTGLWTVVSGAATLIDPTDPKTAVSNLSPGLNTFKWTISNGSCPVSSANVSITREEIPTLANAGTNQTICTSQINLNANQALAGTGTWTLINGSADIDQVNNPNTMINQVGIGANTFRWTISNGNCSPSFDEVTITREAAPSIAFAGANQTVCTSSALMSANTPVVGTGFWTLVSGSGSFANPNLPNTTVTGLSLGINTFAWTISNGACTASTSTVNITREEAPSTAMAGGDQNICANTATLIGNTPSVGSGIWTLVNGSATILNPNNPSTAVADLGIGINTFRWTISNGGCTVSFDEVNITREQAPSLANAGVNQTICTETTILQANTPSIGSGLWKVLAGSAIIANPNNPTTQVNNLGMGINIFEWTVSNGNCTSSSATVTVTRDEPPIIANAGTDQTICTNNTVLNGNNPGSAEGTWTVAAGSAIIANPNSPNTTVSNLSSGTNTFVWTIANGTCQPSVSSVNINRQIEPSTAIAGSPQTVCANTTTLNANTPQSGVGTWSVVSGSGNFVDVNDPRTSLSGLSVGDNVFRWTISNGVCPTSSATVTITRNQEPTVANAGSNQNICSPNTTLNGNSPIVGTGFWTRTQGSGILSDPTSPNTAVSSLSVGLNTFVWTISNGNCNSSSATVTILREENPTLAHAGSDQTICTSNFNLNANTPTVGTGVWTVINGSGVITNPNNPITSVTGLSIGINTFRWTITSACGTSSASVNIIRDEAISSVNAGTNQTICTPTFNLQASNPTVGAGAWTVVAGSGILDNPTDPNSGVTNLSIGTNVFRWTVSNGVCPSASATVTITRLAEPSISTAGQNQTLCASSTTLNANLPTSGTGQWTLVSGNGVFSDPTDPRTSVTNLVIGTNTFRWTISNGNCTSSSSTVSITREEIPTIADAGTDQTLCVSTATLDGNIPAIGTGIWTVIEGNAILNNPNNPKTTLSNLSLGVNRFTWAIDNGTCTASASTVSITRNEEPSNAVAGTNQTTCESVMSLNANAPVVGTGQWSVIVGSATITNPNNPNTTVTGLSIGTNLFRWTVSNGTCSTKSAHVEIIRQEAPTVSRAGSDQDVCTPGATLNANNPLVGIGTWTVTEGSGIVTNPNNSNSTVTGLSLGKNTFKWTINNGTCAVSESFVNIYREDGPTVANAGVNQIICAATVTLNANPPGTGMGTWTIIAGSATVTDPNNPNSGVTGLSPGVNTFRWTISNSCGNSSANVSIIRDELPTLSNAGANQQVCSTTTTLNANTPQVGTGSWTVAAGEANIENPTQPNSRVNGLGVGVNTFVWTISNGTCNISTSTVTITRDQSPTLADAGTDQSLCNQSNTTLNANQPAIGRGAWTQVSGPNTALILNRNSFNSGVNGLIPGIYVFKWTISNGVCEASDDEVVVNIAGSPRNDNTLAVSDVEYCSQEIPNNISIGIENTEVGVTYELRSTNGNLISSALSTGGNLTFGPINSPLVSASYEVFALGAAQGGLTCPAVKLTDRAEITVRNCNLPEALPINLRTDLCTEVKFNLLDSLENSITLDLIPKTNMVTNQGGVVNISPNGMIVYEPRGNFVGVDEFEYEICNRENPPACDKARIRVLIEACTNTPPVAYSDDYSGDNCRSIKGNVLDNDEDAEGSLLLVKAQNPTLSPQKGIFSIQANGDFEYTPSEDFVGLDSVQYETCDDGSGSIVKCSKTTIYLNILGCKDVFIPEGFSPNGDGVNDGFVIVGAENYQKIWLRIYNRWGNLVYENENYRNNWEGIANRGNLTGQSLPDGTYYYVADFDKGRKRLARYLTLRR
ncbi:MAG: PKD domain-containing protein [Microscillaceae bacterium]|nr:PKD domain-containing protein [Microscillaceae bacterium]